MSFQKILKQMGVFIIMVYSPPFPLKMSKRTAMKECFQENMEPERPLYNEITNRRVVSLSFSLHQTVTQDIK